ncbi:LysR family transcriptional regulator [Novosphingobium sp. BL-52-GroH]|uniref:LysR family transcriptional regulator n=1 Tax=Novosphingobium sp. BL-52-GroH TaxID=3349877 RepID=UPI00384A8736
MEIQQLKHLLAAVETGNLLKAADKSFISQSGLSRSIKSLETRLGVPLLIRGPKGVEPTVYGLSVLRRAQIILNEVDKSVDEVRAIRQARVGEVKLGITQNYAGYLVPDLLNDIHRERPGIRFTIMADGFVELLEMVKTEVIDFAFGLIGQIHRSDGIVIEPLREHRSRVFCGRGHPLAQGGTATLQDLHSAQWAMLNSGGVQRGFGIFFESRGMSVPLQVIKTNNIDLIRHLIDDSNLLTVLPSEVVDREVQAGSIVPLDCETPVAQTRVGLFYRDGSLLTPQAELVLDRFRNL